MPFAHHVVGEGEDWDSVLLPLVQVLLELSDISQSLVLLKKEGVDSVKQP